MKLLVHELAAKHVDQAMTAPANHSMLYAVRLHLYRHGWPAGSLRVKLLDSGGKLIGTSQPVAINTITNTGLDYWHGMVRFLLSAPIRGSTDFVVRLEGVGYTFAQNAFVGVCKHESRFAYGHGYSVASGCEKWALQTEFWGFQRASRGQN